MCRRAGIRQTNREARIAIEMSITVSRSPLRVLEFTEAEREGGHESHKRGDTKATKEICRLDTTCRRHAIDLDINVVPVIMYNGRVCARYQSSRHRCCRSL